MNTRISEGIDELQQKIEELLDELLKQAQECEKLDESEDEENVSFLKSGDKKNKTGSLIYSIKLCQSNKDISDKTEEKDTIDRDLQTLENQFFMLLDEVSVHATPLLLDNEINALRKKAEGLSSRMELEEILHKSETFWNTDLFNSRMMDDLLLDDRLYLYDSFKRHDQSKGVLLNSVPFLYIGSWTQGDKFGAWTGYGLFVLAVATGALLDNMFLLGGETHSLGHDENGYYYYRDFSTEGLLTVIGLLSLSYTHSIIRPIIFVNRYNKKLGEYLGLDKTQIRRELPALTLNPPTIGLAMTSDNKLKVQVKLLSLQY